MENIIDMFKRVQKGSFRKTVIRTENLKLYLCKIAKRTLKHYEQDIEKDYNRIMSGLKVAETSTIGKHAYLEYYLLVREKGTTLIRLYELQDMQKKKLLQDVYDVLFAKNKHEVWKITINYTLNRIILNNGFKYSLKKALDLS